MKKILVVALTAVVAIGVAVPVALGATPASVPTMGNKLTCFDGTSERPIYGGKLHRGQVRRRDAEQQRRRPGR